VIPVLFCHFRQVRAENLWGQIESTFKEMDTLATEFESFCALHIQEQYAAPARIESLQASVQQQNDYERKLQLRYENLIVERENWKSLIRERDAAVARAKEEAWAEEEARMAAEAEARANAARVEAESKAAMAAEESEMAIDTDVTTAEAVKEAVDTAAISEAAMEAKPALAAEESEMAIDTDMATGEVVKEVVDTAATSAAMSEAAMESKATMAVEDSQMAIDTDLATAEAVKEVVDTMSDAAAEANGREIVEEVISGNNRVGIPEVVSNADDGAVFTVMEGEAECNTSASIGLSEMVSNASGLVGSIAKEEVVMSSETVSKMVSEVAEE
jgi:hypothetical protein